MDYNRRKGLTAQVHRLQDQVAVHVGTGETTYLTPKQARTLARALYRVANEIGKCRGSESAVGTKHIQIN